MDISHLEPLSDKVVHESRGARVGEHPPHLGRQRVRLIQLAPLSEVEELVIGNALPQKK